MPSSLCKQGEQPINIRYEAISTDIARSLQNSDPDAYGNMPERAVADDSRIPCRHCLKLVDEGDEYLIVAHRPFGNLQPYSETGPIFLHADFCDRAKPDARLPDMLNSPAYLVRGYDADERIIYGTGQMVPTADISTYASTLLADSKVQFVHVRSAENNCFQCRVERDWS